MSKKTNPPAFQFYSRDWLASESINLMEDFQEGWYIRLLAHAWNSDPIGSLPNDDNLLRRLARADQSKWDANKALVLQNFVEKDGRLVNDRLAEQFRGLSSYTRKQKENGRKGAESRWAISGDGDANGGAMATGVAKPMAKDGSSSAFSTSTSSSLDKEEELSVNEAFQIDHAELT